VIHFEIKVGEEKAEIVASEIIFGAGISEKDKKFHLYIITCLKNLSIRSIMEGVYA